MGQFKEIIYNDILTTAIIGWAVAQISKFIIILITQKTLDFSRFVGSGGMPSSHSSFVTALTVKTGTKCGFDSPLFAISAVFALIVMYDAAGVRREAGNQAKILNHIIDDLNKNKGVKPERLKELIGHKPIEVLAGAILGIIIGIVV